MVSPVVAEIAGGFLGGVAKQAVTHPFEVVATLKEIQRGREVDPIPLRKLMLQPQRLFAGFLAAVAFSLPYAVIFHFTMATVGGVLISQGFPPVLTELLSGAAAAVCAAVIGVPLECIKHRMQIQAKDYESLPSACRSALRSQDLYAGFASTLARNVPYNSIQFASFCALNRVLPTSLAGASAGVATAVFTTPLDVINTRLQTQSVIYEGGSALLYSGPFDAARSMWNTEGLGSFIRGAGPRALGYAPSSLVFFVVFVRIQQLLLGSA